MLRLKTRAHLLGVRTLRLLRREQRVPLQAGHPGRSLLLDATPDNRRPAAFYQQLRHLNLEAWEKVTAAVMAVHGEYDWIMTGDDYKPLNAKAPWVGGNRGVATCRSFALYPC